MFKKFPKDPKYIKISLYTFITAGALMILWRLLTSSANLWTSFSEAFSFLWGSIATIVAGLILGYILLPGVTNIEKLFNKIFNKKGKEKKSKRIRLVSIIVLYVILVTGILSIVIFIIPPLVDNIVQFSDYLPGYIDKATQWYDSNLKDSPLFTSEYTKNIVENSQAAFEEHINEIALTVVTTLANSLFSIFSGIIKFVIAFIIAFYFLLSAKDVVAGVSEFGKTKLGEQKAASLGSFLESVDLVFGKYISAKLLQIFIIFIIAQVFFLIIGVTMSTLMAFILALANIIPYVGGFIGMIPPVLISLLESPIKAIWVFAAVQVVQFIDNYIIQPFLIGDKMGLSPFWALVVVLIGGNLFGFIGVLLSIPVAAVIKVLVRKYIDVQKSKTEGQAGVK